jgi:hypothetical protein
MNKVYRFSGVFIGTAIVAGLSFAQGPSSNASFFVTSKGTGQGGNLGGLAGADAHCTALAEAAGIRGKTWRAYLSTATVNARDRIGDGPWYNVKGELIAENLTALHTAESNKISGTTAIDETGATPPYLRIVDGTAQPPAEGVTLVHDILTGTNDAGTVAAGQTCNDWTDGSANATAMLGHADRLGRNPGLNSWTAIHASSGCDMPSLAGSGGAGMFYCFALD